jgi:hypothetical protein
MGFIGFNGFIGFIGFTVDIGWIFLDAGHEARGSVDAPAVAECGW